MATISNNHIAEAIYFATKGKSSSEQSSILKNVVKALSVRRLLSRSAGVISALEKVANSKEGFIEVKIWSGEKVSGQAKQIIGEMLRKKYGDKQFIFHEIEDPNIFGGYKIQVGDDRIDLTLSGKIKRLKEHLNKSNA